MEQRPLHIGRGLLVGVGLSAFFTVLNTLQAPAGLRVANAVGTPAVCAVLLALVHVTATAVQARRNR
jgi:hypothetical protein